MTTKLGAAGLLALLASTAWARQQPAIAITGAGEDPRIAAAVHVIGRAQGRISISVLADELNTNRRQLPTNPCPSCPP